MEEYTLLGYDKLTFKNLSSIILLGKLGVGKSTLHNILQGYTPKIIINRRSKQSEIVWPESEMKKDYFAQTSSKREHCTRGLNISILDEIDAIITDSEGLENLNNPQILLNIE